jgi:biotin transport system substrate-specific component
VYTKNAVIGLSGQGTRKNEAARRAARIITFAVFTAVGAQLAVRLPYTPVPITMQTLFVIMSGIVLGPRDGFYSMLAYLGLGISGAPVFAGFTFGPAVLFGPTGGYLMAFPAAALAGGYVSRLPLGRAFSTFLAAATAILIVLFAGTMHLSAITGMSLRETAALAVTPFLLAEAVKCVIAVVLTFSRRISLE